MNAFPLMAVPMLPIVWALVASAIWWRGLSSPWLFLATATFALFGIQTVISTVWEYWSATNHFLEAAVTPEAIAQRLEESNRRTLILSGLVFLSACPFLLWLKNGFTSAH